MGKELFNRFWIGLVLLSLANCSGYSRAVSPTEQQIATGYLARGVLELRHGRLDQALAIFETSYEIAPTAAALDGAGCVAWRKGNRELAREYFERAIELDPTYAPAYAHSAMIFEALGNNAMARRYFIESIRLDPNQFRVRNNFSAFLYENGDPWRALLEQRKAAVVGGESEIVRANMKRLEIYGKE